MKIGNLELKNPLILAPMLGITDLPFRLICRRCGAGMAYTEMSYVDAILHSNAKTERMMKTCKEDKPLGLQIAGNSGEEFEKFVKSGKWKKFELIDLNCGCPSSRIIGNSAGSFLLREPEKIDAIIKILKKTKKTITVKTRLGFDKINVLKVARAVENAGASAITVHCRLAKDGYGRKADWSWLSKVKKIVKIPVIGNGDVFSGEDAKKMLELCDGVMIGRSAIGDPLIFFRILEYLETGKEEGKNVLRNLQLFREYLVLAKKHDAVNLSKIKYVGGKFFSGFKGAARKREELMGLKSVEEVEGFVGELTEGIVLKEKVL